MAIKLITPSRGQTTTEQILELIENHSEGMTIKELCYRLNRPVSMVNHCLKSLSGSKKIHAKYDTNNQQWIYHS
ncbi:MAG: winged helix-turn-helix domain-containing protein [Chlorogloea purpurea SAG 13.99]|nr:winged helix-turn-helix domain-containing protein [Chlorogloea purpurea SAG 13.99]